MVVPYVLARSKELVTDPIRFVYSRAVYELVYALVGRRSDVAMGVLRARVKTSARGEVMWRLVNSIRQWRCMTKKLCQVCGETAGREGDGIPWILTQSAFQTMSYLPPDCGDTNSPPTCRACWPEALKRCPELKSHARVVTVREVEPVAVLGDVYRPSSGPHWRTPELVQEQAYVPLDEFARLPMVLATQLVLLLHGIRNVEPPRFDIRSAAARGRTAGSRKPG
ncbi:hypothetical protein GT755_33820 [Herbidospora sp. NEAU-GS84]|uniref:Uncharacterized protein n=1 Tax=Herbidospora solisilvae TaxID=2696284 RepID=A0A7C9J8C0_9ACTN|nr:hypothetical protein [Herbidospora solisilvae]NAS26640.1 hypothetical protein [Herbidospora solisilvae]